MALEIGKITGPLADLNIWSYISATALHVSSANAAICPALQNKACLSLFRIQVIEHLNQLFAASIRCVLIEKVELGQPQAEEVTQHYSGFLVTMAILPDFIQALYVALMILGKKKSGKIRASHPVLPPA